MRALTLLCLAFVFAVSSDNTHADTLIGSGVALLSVTRDTFITGVKPNTHHPHRPTELAF